MPALTVAVQDELSGVFPQSATSAIAEIAAMFRFSGGLEINNGVVTLEAELYHPGAVRHLAHLISRILRIEPEILTVKSKTRGQNQYFLRINRDGEKIARLLGLLDTHGRPVRGLPPQIVAGSKADAAAAWRGAFLARGTLMEPGRNGALEVTCPSLEASYGLGGLARRLGITYRARESRGAQRVDIREGEQIAQILIRMGATRTLAQWNELRSEREDQGQSNRLANFDDANMRRSADAAVVAVIRVQRAFEILGDAVPENLRQAGEFRIKYPHDSLNVLGERLTPPATKDAVAGRLRRLNTMADKLAEQQGIPSTLDAVAEAERQTHPLCAD
ncbi:DNA-binding protein WhiA [Arcanobacterium wilhelmae]|uniref:Probable cell division protein WhiA n=1 Tax=Arcanobacterium wilhelmae TaxID=1803177 RepID=A0ABT9N8G1_9ACTO|nr:DNA-binding protein WhiA [Arcanobacterium wilhelmae]MDP9799990.1 DNA-binding protein WhiA [Arcanobacterium wilhelmae]WFN89490.1 DNA-binding protein WhiA [Arcanobacterium wilhelmae]